MAARRTGGPTRSKAQREFVSEAEEILDRMRDGIAHLAESTQSGVEADVETVNRLFRAAHSLKGLSGMFGLEGVSELSHHLEDVLDGLRMGRVALDAAGLALFDEAVTLISSLLEQVGSAEDPAGSEQAIAALVGRTGAWIAGEATETASLDQLDLDQSLLRALTEYEEHRLRENLSRGRTLHVVEADFEIISFEEGLAEISAAIREVGELVSTLPSPGESPESQIRFSLLSATDLDSRELASRLELSEDAVQTAFAGRPRTAESVQAAARPALEEAPSGEFATLKSISDTVRVDIRKLDELMNLVGELAIQRGAIKSIAVALCARPETLRIGAELDKIHKGLERKLQELQAGVLEVRMVPLRQVFDKMSRVVRRLRLDLGKEVRLEISGADTELDKLIVEELVDPLMHLVRNAFDHAIESAEERVAQGKPEFGRVRLEALQRGNDVAIQVSDDGRGIDPDLVLARARERGLVSADANPSRKEIFDLVFMPGFSTRSEVTETSGRGVGMDVVRSNIASLGGIVDVDSQPGRGTTITLTLPITLAIIQALIVSTREQRFAVPLNSVRETLLVDPSEIQHSDGGEILNLRGEALPLRRLAEEFGLHDTDREAKQYAVVLALGDARMGLLVDRLEGQQDTVIKAIQGPVASVRGIAGATELGSQDAVLVLDVSALVEDAMRGRDRLQ